MKIKFITGFFLYIVIAIPCDGQFLTNHKELHPVYAPTGRPRMAAEWEPAIGTLITWPLSLPHKLVIDLAKDNRLYVIVSDRASQQDAVNQFFKWKVMPNQVKFIAAPQDVDGSWTRDWGPHAVFTPSGMKLADAKYLYSTPVSGLLCDDTLEYIFLDENNQVLLTRTDDQIPDYIARSLNLEEINLPFAFTGGNVISDGQRSGFSTCVLTNENRVMGVPDEEFFSDVKQLLGIENHHIISNFEDDGIQHIDCFMKMLDEERLFVMRPPADHPAYEQYEGIVNHELSSLRNAYGRPYKILRLDTDRFRGDELAAYSNSLILNKVIYVPLFGIPQDTVAMRQWREAMPGYEVKGYEFVLKNEPALSEDCRNHYKEIGWNGGDALHCRTRAIWDRDMIYISVDRLPDLVPVSDQYDIRVIIKDYSLQGLIPEQLKLFWRASGKNEWKEVILAKSPLYDQYIGTIPGDLLNRTIEYYISAESLSGKKETMPGVAPEGLYKFTVTKHKRQ